MTITRPHALGNAEVLADLVTHSREFLGPWEPVRPDAHFALEARSP